uniref:PID domain-containing protein n=1 Tax=Heterorhabditis bacteriophora TaxID=37862 RepID=A0A1I7X9W3_HETBA
MSHSLRRVCSVIGRAQFKQVAYTAMEAAGQTYRRQCHVFQTEDLHQVEEIESVLGNAFQAALLAGQGTTLKPMAHNAPISTPVISTADKRPSSSAFLLRILGKGRDAIDDPKAKRRRRPVSAVFSSAIHRLSSSASVVNKRLTTIESPPHKESRQDREHLAPNRINSPVPEEPISKNGKDRLNDNRSSLVFDEKLNEWIYPVDNSTEAQLEQVNYFVKLPSRQV